MINQNTPSLEDAVELALKLSSIDKVRLVEQVMTTLERDLSEQQKTPKRSLLGIWSDVSISDVDIDEARADLWSDFPRNDI